MASWVDTCTEEKMLYNHQLSIKNANQSQMYTYLKKALKDTARASQCHYHSCSGSGLLSLF